jgi:hypothetical protein
MEDIRNTIKPIGLKLTMDALELSQLRQSPIAFFSFRMLSKICISLFIFLFSYQANSELLDTFKVELKTAYSSINGTETFNNTQASFGSSLNLGCSASLAKQLREWLGVRISGDIEQVNLQAPPTNQLTHSSQTLSGFRIEMPFMFKDNKWFQFGPYYRNQDRILYRLDSSQKFIFDKFQFLEKGIKLSADSPNGFTNKIGISVWGGLTESSTSNENSVIHPRAGTTIGYELRLARKTSDRSDISVNFSYELSKSPASEVKYEIPHIESRLGWSWRFN